MILFQNLLKKKLIFYVYLSTINSTIREIQKKVDKIFINLENIIK